MKNVKKKIQGMVALSIIAAIVILSSCSNDDNDSSNSEIESLKSQIAELTSDNKATLQNLAEFEVLDFTVFNSQQWERIKESHSQDVKVYWPDGHMTTGIDKHIEDMKALFVFAPDTRISEHPIVLGSGNKTAVTGVFEGTFTKPMPIGNGQFIQPTGKAFKIPMATIGIWGPDGTMIEEHLFFDNQIYMKQIGL